jgi:CubicO group peptidase (beta-lactamase class C family)
MEGFVHPDFAPVTEKVQQLMSKKSARGGMAVAVYHHGELVVDAWTGQRNAAGDPWTRDTMSMSFSTTKGVVATIVHRLVDRGLLDYDAPVASYWPEFATAGKGSITLRQLLDHQAGLHDVRALADSTEGLLDWDGMVKLLAEAEPAWEVGTRSGYHALTYGYLVGEVIRRVTGLTVNEALQREIVEPLGIAGMYIGAPPEVRGYIAEQLVDRKSLDRLFKTTQFMSRFDRYRPLHSALVIDDIVDVATTEHIHDSEIPAANGVFTARSLARMYAALATPDDFDGPPFVSAETMREATRIQTTGDGRTGEKVGRDAGVLLNMHWRLGYHLVGTTSGVLPQAFGHFGFGGSGGWADPSRDLAVAMVCNRGTGTPIGDLRLMRLSTAALESVGGR